MIEQLDQAVTELLAAPTAKLQSGDAELLPLLRVAAELRQLPREDFKARLKSDLQRKSSMATITETAASIRIVACPRMAFKNVAKAIEFYKNAFGAKETFRFEVGGGIATPKSGLEIPSSCWRKSGRRAAASVRRPRAIRR